MNLKLIGLAFLLADFVALTAYAVYHHGYLAFFDLHAASAIQVQILIDLVIALSFVMVWMWKDARARGIAPLPFTVMTLFLGSIGPLVYMIWREVAQTREAHGQWSAEPLNS